MTVREAIEICDRQKPNGYTDADKIHWLSRLDGMIYEQVIQTHEGGEAVEFNGYSEDDLNEDVELLVYAPYDDLYVKWLFAQIDFANSEIARYNNSVLMFNAIFEEFRSAYNRKHVPLQPNYIKGAK